MQRRRTRADSGKLGGGAQEQDSRFPGQRLPARNIVPVLVTAIITTDSTFSWGAEILEKTGAEALCYLVLRGAFWDIISPKLLGFPILLQVCWGAIFYLYVLCARPGSGHQGSSHNLRQSCLGGVDSLVGAMKTSMRDGKSEKKKKRDYDGDQRGLGTQWGGA